MQQLAQAAMEREAYAEEVRLYASAHLEVYLLRYAGKCLSLCCFQARQAGAVSRLTKVLANTGEAGIIKVQAIPYMTSLCCSSCIQPCRMPSTRGSGMCR